MKVSFQNSQKFKIDELWLREKSVSTLLVPAHLIEALKLKKREHGRQMAVYLRNLLKMYRTLTHSGMLPNPRKIKTEYQEEGLDLKRVSFRPNNADWLELGELALAFGKSRCYVFTFLLELDLTGFWDMLYYSGLNDAVPTQDNLILKVSWSLRRVLQDFSRGYYGFRQPSLFSDRIVMQETDVQAHITATPIFTLTTSESTYKKYKNSSLKAETALALKKRLLERMQTEKWYCDNTLKIQDIAVKLEVSTHHLSQVINELCGQTWSDFITEFRIEAAKQLLTNPDYGDKILAIAFDCGFNNKATFNAAF